MKNIFIYYDSLRFLTRLRRLETPEKPLKVDFLCQYFYIEIQIKRTSER